MHASIGGNAHQLADPCHPDFILMDVQLPDVSGMNVTKAIKADDDLKYIPIIVVTAFASERDEETMLEGGCDAYISRPFSAAHLFETVARFLGDPA